MAECIRVRPERVAQIDYVNWTEAEHSPRATYAAFCVSFSHDRVHHPEV
jgi:hypothetical protein